MDFAVFLLMAFPRYKIFRMLFFKISTSNLNAWCCGMFHEKVCSQFVQQYWRLFNWKQTKQHVHTDRFFSNCSYISLVFFQSLILLILQIKFIFHHFVRLLSEQSFNKIVRLVKKNYSFLKSLSEKIAGSVQNRSF